MVDGMDACPKCGRLVEYSCTRCPGCGANPQEGEDTMEDHAIPAGLLSGPPEEAEVAKDIGVFRDIATVLLHMMTHDENEWDHSIRKINIKDWQAGLGVAYCAAERAGLEFNAAHAGEAIRRLRKTFTSETNDHCVRCGELVEPDRRSPAYVNPTCHRCLLPPSPLPIAKV